VRCAADVIAALDQPDLRPATRPADPAPRPALPAPAPQAAAALRGLVLDRLGPSPLAEDQLIRDLARDSRDIAPIIVDLELQGRITRAPGGLLSRVN
jgi:DNA processing protein